MSAEAGAVEVEIKTGDIDLEDRFALETSSLVGLACCSPLSIACESSRIDRFFVFFSSPE